MAGKSMKGKSIDPDTLRTLQNTPDEDLIDKLNKLIFLQNALDEWYFYPDGSVRNNPKKGSATSVFTNYNRVFVEQAITKEDVELFLEKEKNGTLDLSNSYYRDDAKALKKMFNDNGGAGYIDKLKSDSIACMDMYRPQAKHQLSYFDMEEQEQIDYDPPVQKDDAMKDGSSEGVSYRAKKTYAGKSREKIEKSNKSNLKSDKLYKKDEYQIYNKDKKEKDGDEVCMNDVVQGQLGDCYLMSALAAVAFKKPQLIKDAISYTPGDDYATVRLFIKKGYSTKREPVNVKVNFHFPEETTKDKPSGGMVNVSSGPTSPTYSHDLIYAGKGDNEMWVMLLEKAYAEVMGGYDNIVSGTSVEALAVLTGKEVDKTYTDEVSVNDLGSKLESAIQGGRTATADTKEGHEIPAGYKTEAYGDSGTLVILADDTPVVCGHAYTIIKVDKDAQTVQLRNPHGPNERTKEYITVSFTDFKACFTKFSSIDTTTKDK